MPGSLVRDDNAAQLLDGTALTTTTVGAWVNVGHVHEVICELVTGAVTGTTVVCVVDIELADDAAAAGLTQLHSFTSIDENDDAVTRKMPLYVNQGWIRASATISGTTPSCPLTVTIRLPHDHRVIGDAA